MTKEEILKKNNKPNGRGVVTCYNIIHEDDALRAMQEYADQESNRLEKLVSQKTADEFRKLAEKTYIDLAGELIRLAGEDKVKAKKTMDFMKVRGFDNEDMQIIPILESALWKAYNSRFSG